MTAGTVIEMVNAADFVEGIIQVTHKLKTRDISHSTSQIRTRTYAKCIDASEQTRPL